MDGNGSGSVRRRPGRPGIWGGEKALGRGDYDTAIARLDEAVHLSPGEAKLLGFRGTARLRKGEYAKGADDLKAAIALNRDDAGVGYQPSTNARLSDEALRHGRKQVAAMLHDRPAMAEFGQESEFLRGWAAASLPARISAR